MTLDKRFFLMLVVAASAAVGAAFASKARMRHRTWAEPDSMTARRRCASTAAIGSFAATPNFAANAVPSAPANMPRFRVSTM
jgi:hypothetical protein